MAENETYSIAVECSNCDFNGKTDIPKGVSVEEHPCPNCGNANLSKYVEIITQSYI